MDGWRDPKVREADGRACLGAALAYLARGWSVLPLCPPDHAGVGAEHSRRCDSPGKAPLVAWKAYQQARPSAQEVHGWWRRWPTANVGVALGPVSGLVGIDVDGEEGERELRGRCGGEPPPPTLEFRTPGGGRRLLYAVGAVPLRSTHHDAGDRRPLSFLALGAQTVMPPSRHPGGGVYEWVRYWEAAE
jgi:hypothetical protein